MVLTVSYHLTQRRAKRRTALDDAASSSERACNVDSLPLAARGWSIACRHRDSITAPPLALALTPAGAGASAFAASGTRSTGVAGAGAGSCFGAMALVLTLYRRLVHPVCATVMLLAQAAFCLPRSSAWTRLSDALARAARHTPCLHRISPSPCEERPAPAARSGWLTDGGKLCALLRLRSLKGTQPNPAAEASATTAAHLAPTATPRSSFSPPHSHHGSLYPLFLPESSTGSAGSGAGAGTAPSAAWRPTLFMRNRLVGSVEADSLCCCSSSWQCRARTSP